MVELNSLDQENAARSATHDSSVTRKHNISVQYRRIICICVNYRIKLGINSCYLSLTPRVSGPGATAYCCLIGRIGDGPASRSKCISQEHETLTVHIKVTISHSRSGSYVHTVSINLNSEIVDKGLSSIQKFGKIANTGFELNASFTRSFQIILNNFIPSKIYFFLSWSCNWLDSSRMNGMIAIAKVTHLLWDIH
jgi:hypothetical protein